MPVCLLGLLHNSDLLAAHLIGEGGDDGSGGDGSGSSDRGGANPWVSSGEKEEKRAEFQPSPHSRTHSPTYPLINQSPSLLLLGALAKRISSGYFSSVFSPSSSLASLGGGQRTPHAHARPHPEVCPCVRACGPACVHQPLSHTCMHSLIY